MIRLILTLLLATLAATPAYANEIPAASISLNGITCLSSGVCVQDGLEISHACSGNDTKAIERAIISLGGKPQEPPPSPNLECNNGLHSGACLDWFKQQKISYYAHNCRGSEAY